MLRSAFQIRMKTSVPLREIVGALNDNQRGVFQSRDQVQELVTDLVKLLPEWLEAKDIGQSGRFLRLVDRALPAPRIYELIKQRVTTT